MPFFCNYALNVTVVVDAAIAAVETPAANINVAIDTNLVFILNLFYNDINVRQQIELFLIPHIKIFSFDTKNKYVNYLFNLKLIVQ